MIEHMCLTCKLAEWKKTVSGRLHPDGSGRCRWKPGHIPTPASWRWDTWRGKQPVPAGGRIERRPSKPITECETYEALK